MKVLIVSEGIHELGGGSSDPGERHDHAGALQALVQRLLPGDHEFISRPFNARDIQTIPGKGRALFKRMLLWLKHAERNGFDGAVILIDEDGDVRRHADVEAAQEQVRFRVARACGLAIREFDAWIVADEQALSAALGCTVPCQPSPEGIRDPKRTFADLHAASPCRDRPREVYAAVLAQANLDLLAKRCPRGLKPFVERVRGMIGRPA